MNSEDEAFIRTDRVGPCPSCASEGARALFTAPDRLHGVAGYFSYRRCVACATVFQDPRVAPEDLWKCYPKAYYNTRSPGEPPSRRFGGARDFVRKIVVGQTQFSAPRSSIGGVFAACRVVRERAFFGLSDEMIPRESDPGRALDVGCGTGEMLGALGKVGWRAEGVEWDAAAATFAERTSGRPVHVGDFRSLSLPAGAYSLIIMNHVFEHMDDPVDALSRLKSLLTVNGRLVLVFPNPDALGAKVFREYWFPWEVPRHLVLVTTAGLTLAANRSGLKVVRTRTTARSAAIFAAWSRSYRRGLPGCTGTPNLRDRAIAACERAAVLFGYPAGEEIIAVLRLKSPSVDP